MKTIKPATITGLKSLAKELKRSAGLTHTDALNLAAQKAGFQNYTHAHSTLRRRSARPKYEDPRKPFRDANTAEWAKIVRRVNPNMAETQYWYTLPMIARALRPFMGNNRNHALLPTGGGVDLTGVEASQEHGCLKLIAHGMSDHVLRPKSLCMVTFPNDPGQSFLLLELDDLKPSGVYDYLFDDDETGEARRKHIARGREEVVNLNGTYLDLSVWEEDLYVDSHGLEQPLSDAARRTLRWFGGKYLIVAKGSIWNSITATYDGRHNKMSEESLRVAIQHLIDKKE